MTSWCLPTILVNNSLKSRLQHRYFAGHCYTTIVDYLYAIPLYSKYILFGIFKIKDIRLVLAIITVLTIKRSTYIRGLLSPYDPNVRVYVVLHKGNN